MKESLVINKIKKICDEMNIDFYRVHAGRYQSRGMFDCYLVFPDGYLVFPDKFCLWVEIKMNNGKLTELQNEFYLKKHFCMVIKINRKGEIKINYNRACRLNFEFFNLDFLREVEKMKFQVRE